MDNLNPNSSAVRRLQRELIELSRNPPDMFTAAPLDDNLFEWHFTIRGGDDTAFAGGLYHGRILLPPTYPHKPPDVVFLTPNGRFKINEKICLSITGYHPEHWSAVWDIRAALTALIAFLPTPPNGAIGSLDYSNEERAMLAKKSVNYCCKTCGIPNSELLEICGEGETKDIQKKANAMASRRKIKKISARAKTIFEVKMKQQHHVLTQNMKITVITVIVPAEIKTALFLLQKKVWLL
eukprot:jgi/Bigna1/89122/estExt_fgenesh1_pg.C_440040